MKRRIGVNGTLIAVAVIAIALRPLRFLRVSVGKGDEWVELLGFFLLLVGLLLRVSSRGYKSDESRNGHALVQGGPYQLVRNPMYLGILLIGCGVNLVLFQGWVLALFVAVFALRYYPLMRREERWLADSFHEEYARYCAKVPRFLPRPGAFFLRDCAEFLPLRGRWLGREASSLILVPLVCVAVVWWKSSAFGDTAKVLRELAGFATVAVVVVLTALRCARRYERATG